MPFKHDASMAEDLAVHVARGGRVSAWAKDKDISEHAAFRLHKKPGVQLRIATLRAEMTEAAVGMASNYLDRGMARLAQIIAKGEAGDTVMIAAVNALVAGMAKLKSIGDLEARIAKMEAEIAASKGDAR